MATVLCVCEECGSTFFLKNELYAPAFKNPYKIPRKDKKPITWDDWLVHLSSNCENCRLKEIPSSCVKDYEKLKSH